MTARGLEHWVNYNEHQKGRLQPRELLSHALREVGDGVGRIAIDIGSGAGVETRALLARGWHVHAYDYDADAIRSLVSSVTEEQGKRLRASAVDLATLDELPPADLIYSGYTLSWLPPDVFNRVWQLIARSLKTNAVLAANIFGDKDDWASDPDTTCLSEAAVRTLLDDLQIVQFSTEDEDGMAFGGPKHWHVFDVIARA